ncbi:hypothetical protein ATANTOWER_011717 [Ataeniobius toweri]|uniref:Uncharacterized protein n=1 Tax=Ataeniobius toweri TaxID=208326 RepID=A0ABU7A5Q7_9TELE|nr:hypothetical protein [Ataeniobius toweri]
MPCSVNSLELLLTNPAMSFLPLLLPAFRTQRSTPGNTEPLLTCLSTLERLTLLYKVFPSERSTKRDSVPKTSRLFYLPKSLWMMYLVLTSLHPPSTCQTRHIWEIQTAYHFHSVVL